jgi:hypothetical protein
LLHDGAHFKAPGMGFDYPTRRIPTTFRNQTLNRLFFIVRLLLDGPHF